MEAILEQLLGLCSQLLAIGQDEPEVLIASMFIIFGIAVTIVVCATAVVASLPYTLMLFLIRLIKWLWRRKHPVKHREVPFKEPEVNYMPVKKPKPEVHRTAPSAPVSDLPPVYPKWMNQKSGRLL